MFSSPDRYFALLLLGAIIALPLRSAETPPPKTPGSKKTNTPEKKTVAAPAAAGESKKPVDLKKLDLSSLPADAVLILCEHAKDALDLVPKAVLLTPEKYQKMRDEIENLKKQPEMPATPTRCLLRGKVEPGAVRLEAEFGGRVEQASTLVTLACPQALALAAETEGRMALIRRAKSGDFLVQIDKAGEYHVKLALVLPLSASESNGRSFELTLPRTVITQLEVDLPANTKDLRVSGRTLDEPQLCGLKLDKNQHLSGNPSLEPVDKLSLSWKEVRPSTGAPVRTAEGRIHVQVDSVGQSTEAELVLKVEGTPTNIWRLLVPRKAEIKVLPQDESRLKTPIETADQKFTSLRTLHLKEPSSDPLRIQIKVPLTPRTSSITPVGPFFVLDAVRQTGIVEVTNSVRTLHLDYRGYGNMQLQRQPVGEGAGDLSTTVATFTYSNIPMREKPTGVTGPNSLSWLDVEARIVHPRVRTHVSHTLRLRPSPTPPSGSQAKKSATERRWEIVTTIALLAGKWTDLDQLKVFVPPEWKPLDDTISVEANANPPYAAIPPSRLREATGPSLLLEGHFEASYTAEGRAVLKLPKPQGSIELCEVKIEVPADDEVILNNPEAANLEMSKQPRPSEQTWLCSGSLANDVTIDVSWRPYRPDLHLRSVVDLTLNRNHGDVRHELVLQLPPAPPHFLSLRVPPAVKDSLRIEGDSPQTWRAAAIRSDGTVHLPISAKDGGKEWRQVLHYKTSWSETDGAARAEGPFTVPLIVPGQETAGDIRVRIWSEPGFLPRPAADRHWEERGIEEVKDRDLPVLVLHATKLDVPLRLRLGEQAASFSVLVERALVRVRLSEDGVQNWQVRYQLRQLADRDVYMLLPGPVVMLNARFLFNRHKVTPDILNDQGERSDGGSIARLHLSPDLVRQSAVLDVSFQSMPGRTGRTPLQTVLHPPRIRGAPTVPTRWEVSVPGNRVLLGPESASDVERAWTRRGWLLAPRLQRSNIDVELEHSFEKALPVKPLQENDLFAVPEISPVLVCWQDQTAPIVLTHAPQQAWLLVCSLGVLIVGLGVYWSVRPRSGEGRLALWLWPLLIALTLTFALGALFWPATVSAVAYGCEPGILVLLAVIGLQWLMHQRYRRQIVFLPSFSRGRSGSSLIRSNSSNRPQSGEPSTVDAPPPSVG